MITVADKTYGLADFYSEETLKRFRSTRRGDSDAGAKKKIKPKSKQKPKSVEAAKKSEPKPKAATKQTAPSPGSSHSDTADDAAASEPIH